MLYTFTVQIRSTIDNNNESKINNYETTRPSLQTSH